MKTDSQQESLTRGIVLLLTLVAVVTAALGLLQQRTAGNIAANAAAHAILLIDAVLPGVDYDNVPATDRIWLTDSALGQANPLPAYRARLGNEVTAVVLTVVAPQGYVGPIELLVSLDPEGQVIAAQVSRHRETPGLGDRIEAGKSDWIRQFDNSAADTDWMLASDGGEFDSITGATVTSRAVLGALAAASTYYLDNQGYIYSAPAAGEAE